MARTTSSEKNGAYTLHYKLDKTESINERLLAAISNDVYRKILPVNVANNRKAFTSVTWQPLIPLDKCLRGGINKEEFFIIIKIIVKQLLECESKGVDPKSLLLEHDKVFLKPITNEFYFACWPINFYGQIDPVFQFFLNIPAHSVFDKTEDQRYLQDYVQYFQTHNIFILKDFDDFLDELKDKEYPPMPIQQPTPIPQPRPIPQPIGGGLPYPGPVSGRFCGSCGSPMSAGATFCGNCGMQASDILGGIPTPEPIPAPTPAPTPAPAPQPNDWDISSFGNSTSSASFGGNQSGSPETGTMLLGEDPTPVPAPTPVWGGTNDGDVMKGTVLLGNDFFDQKYPYFVRTKNNEKIMVDKPVYRIGKERQYCDYFVADNTAVSRSHADIITRDGRFFIVDKNSTNKTYIDGNMIDPEIEIEIFNNTKIVLGNEEFIFYID